MAQYLCSVSIKRAEVFKWSDTLGEIVECVDRNISHEAVEKVINYLIKSRKLIIIIAFFSNLPVDPNI